MNPHFRTDFSISDSLIFVRKSVLIYETIIKREMIRLNKLENNIVVDEKGQVSYRNVCP